MNLDTMVKIVDIMVPIVTVALGMFTFAERIIRRRIQRALKDVQDRLSHAETTLENTTKRHRAILIYARRLYDMMNRAQMNPPEPPEAFFEN